MTGSYALWLADGTQLSTWTDITVEPVGAVWVVYAIDAAGDTREVRSYDQERMAREARWHLLTRKALMSR